MALLTAARTSSEGNAWTLGMPPASETTSGREATANSARTSDADIPAVRAAYRSTNRSIESSAMVSAHASVRASPSLASPPVRPREAVDGAREGASCVDLREDLRREQLEHVGVIEELVVQHDALDARAGVLAEPIGCALGSSDDAIALDVGSICVERPRRGIHRVRAPESVEVLALGPSHEAPCHQRGLQRGRIAARR